MSPRIYVADLAAYNEGRLVGHWINLEGMDAEDVHAAIQRRVLEPGHEEWAIHDYDEFGTIKVGEYDSLETVVMHAQNLIEHAGKYEAWIEDGREPADFDADLVRGPFDSESAYVDDHIEGIYGSLDLIGLLEEAGLGGLKYLVEWRDSSAIIRDWGNPLTEVRRGAYGVEYYEVEEG